MFDVSVLNCYRFTVHFLPPQQKISILYILTRLQYILIRLQHIFCYFSGPVLHKELKKDTQEKYTWNSHSLVSHNIKNALFFSSRCCNRISFTYRWQYCLSSQTKLNENVEQSWMKTNNKNWMKLITKATLEKANRHFKITNSSYWIECLLAS